MDTNEMLAEIDLERRRFARDEALDGTWYNGSVIVVLALTGAATIVGSFSHVQPWVAPLLSGLATIFVSIDRALQWGPRWMWNRSLWGQYTSLKRSIETLNILSAAERDAEIKRIRQTFLDLPRGHSAVPGINGKADG